MKVFFNLLDQYCDRYRKELSGFKRAPLSLDDPRVLDKLNGIL